MNWVEVAMLSGEMFWALNIIFICCECGERVSNAFEEINDAIDELDWYLYPIEVQKILPTIIMHAQMPVIFKCFGNIACTRAFFKTVSLTLKKARKISFNTH